MGRCLLSNAGYCHVTSLDTDPLQILDLCCTGRREDQRRCRRTPTC